MMEENQTHAPDGRRRSRMGLVMLAAIAFLPLLVAYVIFFYVPSLAPTGTTNEGELIVPPIPVAALDERLARGGKWTLLMVSGEACDEACERSLYLARQVNVALGKDAQRVRRVLLVEGERVLPETGELLEAEYPRMTVLPLGRGGESAALLKATGGQRPGGYIFLSDPNGNVMMYYTPEHDGNQVLKDLKHLLRLSNIG